jgi:SAM-dependent methyltransferase
MKPQAYVEMAATEDRHWWFVGRRRIAADTIAHLGLPQPARILEGGAGTGGNLALLSGFGEVEAMELDAAAREHANAKSAGSVVVRAGAFPNEVPFAPGSFDLVCLFDVLEHVEQDVETLQVLRGLLRPGGRILLTVPAYRFLWSAHDEFLLHKRRYTAGELATKARAGGLKVRKISYFNTVLFPLAALARLADRLRGGGTASGTAVPPAAINRLFAGVLGIEAIWLRRFSLPFGVSLLAVLEA